MVEIMNSSFIPKKEFKKKDKKKKHGINIFFLMSLTIFLTAVIGSIGVYLWRIELIKGNGELKKNFTENGEKYGIESIKEYSLLDKRIKAARNILSKHYNIMPIFEFLEIKTLSTVTLISFEMVDVGDKLKIKARGKTFSLTDIQLQGEEYSSDSSSVENLILSNVERSREGYREFDIEFDVNKKYLTNRDFIN